MTTTAADAGEATLLLSMPETDGTASWREEVLRTVRTFDGFREADVFPPLEGVQDRWVLVLRFAGPSSLQAWLQSPELAALSAKAGETPSMQVVAGRGVAQRPVTLVVETRVEEGQAEAFRRWQAEMTEAESRFPGFVEGKVMEPVPGVSDMWSVLVRFDSEKHLDAWLQSDERQRLIEAVEPTLRGEKMRRVVTSFEGWFQVDADTPAPPNWKQAVAVLLGLYPIVLLDSHFLIPRLMGLGWGIPEQMILVNCLNISLLTWLVQPFVNRTLKPWLYPSGRPRDAAWLTGIAASLAAMAIAYHLLGTG